MQPTSQHDDHYEQTEIAGLSSDDKDAMTQQTISLCGDPIYAALIPTGELYLSLPSLCAALGLNVRGQLQRIQRTPELSDGLAQLFLITRGGSQRVNCLHSEKLFAWLSTLQVRSMNGQARAKLTRYLAASNNFSAATLLSSDTQATPIIMEVESQPIQITLPLVNDNPTLEVTAQPILVVEEQQDTLAITVQPELLAEEEENTLAVGTVQSTEQIIIIGDTTDLPSRQEELRTLLTRIPYISSDTTLVTTSFQEDRAIREATLARKADWEKEPTLNRMRYRASNKLLVYIGNPDHPLSINDALERIRALGETTILTARILLGLWNIRRSEGQLSKDGSAAIRVDEILAWRGVQKHTRVYESLQKRFTDGYQWKHKQQVHRDVLLLEQCYLRGYHNVIVKGRNRRFLIDSPYLRVASVKDATQVDDGEPVGYFIAPGAWINTYEEHGNLFFVELDRRIFQLNPQNEQIALRIALYLTEYWRQLARTGNFEQPISMHDLLLHSMVPIDEGHLTSRFAPRVEEALDTLIQRGIVGEAHPLVPIDKTKAHWGRDWLMALWLLLPPIEAIEQHSMQALLPAPAPAPMLQPSLAKKQKKGTKDQ